MSQQQPQRPQTDRDPIKYGEVFDVQGDLASKPIAPQDAANMQAAENEVLGETQRGGPASIMQSAASVNLRSGLVDPDELGDDFVRGQDVTVCETEVGRELIITERVAGQVVARYIEPRVPMTTPGSVFDRDAVTIGDALEATALSAGNKPVDQSDVAAVQAAEVRATGAYEVLPGGVGAQAQSAADRNARARRGEDKTTLSGVLGDAAMNLPGDKPVTREDAERVIEAEVRNKQDTRVRTTRGGGGVNGSSS